MRPMSEEELESVLKQAAQLCVTLRQATEDQEGHLRLKAQQHYCALASMLHRFGILQQFSTIAESMKQRGIIGDSDDRTPGEVAWLPKDEEGWLN